MSARVGSDTPVDRDGATGPTLFGFVAVATMWTALVAGVGQGLITAVDVHLRHRIVYASRDVYWMAPLSYLIMLAALSVTLLVVVAPISRRTGQRVVLTTLTWCALFSLTLPYGHIARWASAVLTLGLAVAVGRWLLDNPAKGARRMRGQAMALGAAVLLVGAGTRIARSRDTARAVAALPAPPSGAPNVLLIILDTVRAASMHLYGFERENTPVLDSLAASSTVFDNAIATAPWTLPSHASMFTGRYPATLPANYVTPLDTRHTTLSELLASQGYLTAGFVANHHYTGYDTGLARGFALYEDYKVSLTQLIRTSWAAQALSYYFPSAFGLHTTAAQSDMEKTLTVPPKTWADLKRGSEVVDEFLQWETERPERPYFAFLNFYDAHDPRYAPPDIRRQFVSRYPNRDWYDASIAYMDRELGRLFDTLRRQGTLDRTVVIVASDHGELFGNHRLWGHANSLYLDVLRVPLLVRYPPRVRAGLRVTRPVSLRDLTATITDLASVPRTQWLPGTSLVPVMEGKDSVALSPAVSYAHRTINLPTKFPAARGDMFSVIDDSLHYIRNLGDGGQELFNWKSDAREETDHVKNPAYAQAAERLRTMTHDSLVGGTRR